MVRHLFCNPTLKGRLQRGAKWYTGRDTTSCCRMSDENTSAGDSPCCPRIRKENNAMTTERMEFDYLKKHSWRHAKIGKPQ